MLKKTYLALLLICALSLSSTAEAQISNTVTWTWQDAHSIPLANCKVDILPKAVGTNGAAQTSLDKLQGLQTDTNGTLVLTNLAAGGYTGTLHGPQNNTAFTFVVPATNGNFNGKDLAGVPTATGSSIAYSMVASDARYVAQSNGVLTGPLNASTQSITNASTLQSSTVISTNLKGNASAATNLLGTITGSQVSDATSANTASTIVKRDASGNFSAGTITANLNGTASNVPGAGIIGTVSIVNGGTGATTGRAASGNVGTLYASPVGGQAGYADAQSANVQFEGQPVISYWGQKEPYIFYSGGSGVGSNVLGHPVTFFDGINGIGNDSHTSGYWEPANQTNNDYTSGGGLTVYLMNGPISSTHKYATNGNYRQPYFNVMSGNGWSDQGAVCVQTLMTNAHKAGNTPPWGTNADGTVWYKPTWGLQFIEIGDAYLAGDPTANPESQLAGSDIFALQSIPDYMPLYAGVNVQRPGDTNLGIAPWIGVNYSNAANSGDALVSFPKWSANVWAITNSNWKGTLNLHLGSGNVDMTNGVVTVTQLRQPGTNANSVEFGSGQVGEDSSAPFNVNENTSFNGVANNIMVTVAGSSQHNFGIGSKSGLYSGLVAGSGRYMKFYVSSASDLLATAVGSQTWTEMGGFDPSGNFYTTTGYIQAGAFASLKNNTTGPTAAQIGANGAAFWCSNGIVYCSISLNGSTISTVKQIAP